MKQIDVTGRYSPMPDLEKATMDALVEWYNKHSGSTQIKKFSTREVAAKRCAELKAAMDQLAAHSAAPKPTKGTKESKPDMSKTNNNKTAKGKGKKTAKGKGSSKKTNGLLDMTLQKLVDKNPRREGTHGFKSFGLIRNGMTYRQYIDAGGRNNDIRWDIAHKYVKLVPAASKA